MSLELTYLAGTVLKCNNYQMIVEKSENYS